MRMGVAVGEGEVGGVVGHRVASVLYPYACVGDGEVGVDLLRYGDALYGVAFLLARCGIEGFLELHIGVERVIFRSCHLLGDAVIDWDGDFCLVGEELAEFHARRQLEVALVVLRPGADTILKSAKSVGDIFSLHIDATHVGELDVEIAVGSPSATVVVFLETELIDPHLAALHITGEVADTDNHRLHLAKGGIAENGNLVVGVVGIIGRVRSGIGGRTEGPRLVALLFDIGEDGEGHIEHVVVGPHLKDVAEVIAVVVRSRCRELQWYLIFIVVALIVGTEPNEDRQLVVLQIGCIDLFGIGMNEHLQTLVLSHVESCILIDALRLSRREIVDIEL